MRALSALFLCIASGFLAGFALTYWTTHSTSTNLETPPEQQAKPSPSSPLAPTETSSEERIAAVLALAEKPRDEARDHALYTALQKLSAAELKEGAPGMVAVLKRLGEKHAFAVELGEAWMERWLDVDASAALQFLTTSRIFDDLDPNGEWKDYGGILGFAFEGVFKAVARREPEWARAYLAGLEPNARRNCGVYRLAEAIGTKDGIHGKQFLSDFMEGANRHAAVKGYVLGLAQRSPSEAFQLALAETAGPFRDLLLDKVVWEAAAQGRGSVRTLLDRVNDTDTRERLTGKAIGDLAHRTRENVFPWLKEEMTRRAQTGDHDTNWHWEWAVQETLRTQDFGDSADFALTLAKSSQDFILQRVTSDWAQFDPTALRTWLKDHAPQMDAETVGKLHFTLARMVDADGAAASAWLDTLPDGALRDSFRLETALAQAKSGNLEPMRVAYASLAASDSKGTIAEMAATALAKANGPNAAEWLSTLPLGAARTAATRKVAGVWGERDPLAAGAWIKDLPAGKDRDVAIEGYAPRIALAVPSAAAEWILEISDSAVREKAASSVFWLWQQDNAGAAAEWLKQLPGISEEARQKLLRPRQ